MSYTGVFSECETQKGKNPIINDLKGLKNGLKNMPYEYGETLAKIMDTGEILTGDYPKKQYKTLRGFRTWGEDKCEYMNLERIGFGFQGTHEWAEIFEVCSKFTEPFFVFHSPTPNDFPNLLNLTLDKENNFVLKGIFNNGKSEIKRIVFSKKEIKEVM